MVLGAGLEPAEDGNYPVSCAFPYGSILTSISQALRIQPSIKMVEVAAYASGVQRNLHFNFYILITS